MNVKWWAHRGAGVSAPENTLEAIALGYDRGFRAIEFDAMLTRDGTAVLHHDWNIGRTAKLTSNPLLKTVKAHAALASLTSQQVLALDAGVWHSEHLKGVKVPTLIDALALCTKLSLTVNLELKSPPNVKPDALVKSVMGSLELFQRTHETERIGQLKNTMPNSDAQANVIVSSFDVSSLYAMRTSQYKGPMAILFESLPNDWITHAVNLDVQAIHLSADHVTETDVRRIHTTQRRVRVYTVNDLNHAKRLFHMGVDAVFTDNMDLPSQYEAE